MKIIYIGMPLYKFGDQSVNSGKRTLVNKKGVCKFQIFGVNVSNFYEKNGAKGMLNYFFNQFLFRNSL